MCHYACSSIAQEAMFLGGGGLWRLEGCQLTRGDRHRLRMSTGYHRAHFSHSDAKYDAAVFVNKSKYIGQSFISVN